LTTPPNKFQDLVVGAYENLQEDLADYIEIAQEFMRAYAKNLRFRDGNVTAMLANSFYAKSLPLPSRNLTRPNSIAVEIDRRANLIRASEIP
jgi:hypothetical protein